MKYGLAAPLIALGCKAPTWQVRVHETHEYVEFDLGLLARDTRHPYRLQCEQFRLCELLVDRLRRSKHVRFEWGARATGFVSTADGVVLETHRGDEVRKLTGRLLVGADGASSCVREALGVEFSGTTYNRCWVSDNSLSSTNRYGLLNTILECAWHVSGLVIGLVEIIVVRKRQPHVIKGNKRRVRDRYRRSDWRWRSGCHIHYE